MFVMEFFSSIASQPMTSQRKTKMPQVGRGGRGKVQFPWKSDGGQTKRGKTISDLFRTPAMMSSRLGDLLFKIGKVNVEIPDIIEAPKSHGFIQAVPMIIFDSMSVSVRAHFRMFSIALKKAGWAIKYCPRVRVNELEVVSQNLYQVPVWCTLDLQHKLSQPHKGDERIQLDSYNTHPLATMMAMILNPLWLESMGTVVDGVKIGGADIVTVILPGLTQKFCTTQTHKDRAMTHCIVIQVHSHMKKVHIGLRPVKAVPCGSMLIPLVVPS